MHHRFIETDQDCTHRTAVALNDRVGGKRRCVVERRNRPARIDQGKAAADKRGPKKVPADITVPALAKAMWTELKLKAEGGKERVLPEQRAEAWKRDQKEYKQVARRVVARLTRRAGRKDRPRAGRTASAAGSAES